MIQNTVSVDTTVFGDVLRKVKTCALLQEFQSKFTIGNSFTTPSLHYTPRLAILQHFLHKPTMVLRQIDILITSSQTTTE